MIKIIKRILLVLGIAALGVAGYFVHLIGPRNIIGMLRYDQRHPGTLRVGDPAPDTTMARLDGSSRRLLERSGGRPVVLIFGSYT
ncbi:MAG TPA: hypothetical protein VMM92_09610 [Thermoanaerobaculia bacterium]|nr:hypothetical protein [Thermoanaerobaculia bacterium]